MVDAHTETNAPGPSLYDRIGGEGAIAAAVDIFYDKVIADPVLAPFFVEMDMPSLVKKQIAFMSRAFGGPAAYGGRDPREAHAKLVAERGLNDRHFDAVAGHLKSTLEELGVAAPLVAEALGLVGSLRAEVLNR